MNMKNASPTLTRTAEASDAARPEGDSPERIRQGITSEVVGRLTKDPVAHDKATSMNIAVNVPHRDQNNEWKESTTFVNALAVGDAHRSIAAGDVPDLKKGAMVKLDKVNIEQKSFTRGDGTPGSAIEAKVFTPDQVSVLQAPRVGGPAPRSTAAAGKGNGLSDDQPPF